MNALIVGIGSDIGRELACRLIADGWRVQGTYNRDKPSHEVFDKHAPIYGCASVALKKCDLTNHVDILDLAEFSDKWDLLLFASGTMEPIGRFGDVNPFAFWGAVKVNALGPLMVLSTLLSKRLPNARVIFIGGPNLSKPTPTYTAYRAGKAMLASLCETLEVEYPDCRFQMLNPGVVRTKIHDQTLKAGAAAANYERVLTLGNERTVTHDEVYEKLKAML